MNKHCESAKGSGRDGKAASTGKLDGFIRDADGWAFEAAYRLAGNREDAKELVQEAMFRLVKSWSRYDGAQPVEAWFRAILRNLFYDGCRKAERRLAVSLDSREPEDGSEPLSDRLPGGDEGIETRLLRAERAKLTREAMNGLRKVHRAVLRACDIEGLPYEIAARRLGVTRGTLASRLSRARAAFRTAVVELNQGGSI